jgi:hypothetical protein
MGRIDHPATRITQPSESILLPALAESLLVAAASRAIVMCFIYRNAVRMYLSWSRGRLYDGLTLQRNGFRRWFCRKASARGKRVPQIHAPNGAG